MFLELWSLKVGCFGCPWSNSLGLVSFYSLLKLTTGHLRMSQGALWKRADVTRDYRTLGNEVPRTKLSEVLSPAEYPAILTSYPTHISLSPISKGHILEKDTMK